MVKDAPSEGLFTEGACVLIEGDYTEDETFVVIAIGHPPCESREAARAIYGHVDFLGKGATTPAEDVGDRIGTIFSVADDFSGCFRKTRRGRLVARHVLLHVRRVA